MTTDKIKSATNDLNFYLRKIANYVNCYKLKLNVAKTESISIVGQCSDLRINNIPIKKCNKVKYLGLTISSNFKSINHVNYIIDKVNSARAQLKTAFDRKILHPNVKSLMYKQLIRPIILYACSSLKLKN